MTGPGEGPQRGGGALRRAYKSYAFVIVRFARDQARRHRIEGPYPRRGGGEGLVWSGVEIRLVVIRLAGSAEKSLIFTCLALDLLK